MLTLTSAIIPVHPSGGDTSVAGNPWWTDLHWQDVVAGVFLTWYIIVALICALGHIRMWILFNHPSPIPQDDKHNLPFVSILRPIKGWEPNLELCLNSACLLDYPQDLFEVVFCVADGSDSALSVIQTVIAKNPNVRTKLSIGEEPVGPNPKIRNLSRAYTEALGDVIWILDSNIWVNPGILRRSVRQLEGTSTELGYKLVHHLPLCVDVTDTSTPDDTHPSKLRQLFHFGGGRLEENFMSSSHAKFYCAINSTGLAPCVVGKSNIFRRSHLLEATRDLVNDPQDKHTGINYFAENICEDHLLAEKLWLTPLTEEKNGTRAWRKHGMAKDVVFQPIENMPVSDYLARRTRWIAVRKYSVLGATLVEPMTESFLASLMLSFSLTCLFPHYVGCSWTSFWSIWATSVLAWAVVDRILFNFLHQYRSTEVDENSPRFISRQQKRSFGAWVLQWVGRETLAFGIWAWAMYPGTITWRGGRYRVRFRDMKVEQIPVEAAKAD